MADEDSKIYCVCRQICGGRPMIACDICEEWYHKSCVKQFSNRNSLIWQWQCPQCVPIYTGKWVKREINKKPAVKKSSCDVSEPLCVSHSSQLVKPGTSQKTNLNSWSSPKLVSPSKTVPRSGQILSPRKDSHQPSHVSAFNKTCCKPSLKRGGVWPLPSKSPRHCEDDVGVPIHAPAPLKKRRLSLKQVSSPAAVNLHSSSQELSLEAPSSQKEECSLSPYFKPKEKSSFAASPKEKCSLSPDFKGKEKSRLSASQNEKFSLSPDFKPKKNAVSGSVCLSANQKSDSNSKIEAPNWRHSEDKKAITCKFCKLVFSSWQTVSRHRKTCQMNPDSTESLLNCNACGKQFARRYIYLAHVKGCHSSTESAAEGKKRVGKKTKCPVPGCNQEFLFKTSVHQHLIDFHHRTDLKGSSNLTFQSYDKFLAWKTQIEDTTFSYYSQQYGKRNGRLYFYCQKDGDSRCHDKVPERKTLRRNYKGSVKKNQLCLSMMAVTSESDGNVKVRFYPSHSHKCLARDLKFQPLSRETNEFISRQLARNVPPRKIVENLRDDSYKRENRWKKHQLKRDNLVKVKTIAERKRKRKGNQRYADDDATSVFMKAQVLMKETFNPLVIYKPQGEKLVIGPAGAENLPNDVFMFGLQTQEQMEMMKKHSKVILAMGETHGTNQCGFKLLNMVVKDEFNLGYPVGHLITSRSDEATLQFFFKAIKDRCPDLAINCCITDDDPALINSLEAGVGEKIWHILCIWHIHRTVQCKLKEHVKSTQLVDEMYQILCLIIDAKTEENFNNLVEAFLREFGQVSVMYKKYFEGTFLPKAKKWAMCYRMNPHGGVETTMLVESFHNILKSVYLKRIPNRRVDDLIDLLLQIEEDYFVRHNNATELETLLPRDVKKIRERHQRGKNIADEDVLKVSSCCYQVKSQEKDTCEEYKVVRCLEKCDVSSCVFLCPICAVCSHMYQCTCPDTQPLCKHIHKVHLMYYIPSNLEASGDAPSVDQEPEFFLGENMEESLDVTESVVQNPDFTIEKKLEKIRDIMKEVENQLENSPVKKFMLSRIQNVLSDLHQQCTALVVDNIRENPVHEMGKQINIYPNEKMQTQVKPFKRVKKSKKKGLQRPSKKSAEEIKKFLFQEDDENNEENVDDVNCPTALSDEENSQQRPGDELIVVGNDLQDFSEETIINEFFQVLAKNEDSLHSCHTSVAQVLCEGTVNKALGNIPCKDSILIPAKLTGSEQWSVAALCVNSQELWYFNPMAKPHSSLSHVETKFLSSLASCGRSIFPAVKKWTIQRHYDPQEDNVSSAVFVCWFGYHISVMGKGPAPLLTDVAAVKREIYDAIGI